MKKISHAIWGLVLVAVGVIFALNALEITDVDLFFDGWWTLFIIVPCAVGLFTEREKVGNIIGVCIGVFLLLCSQEVFDFSILWKLLVPALIVLLGLKLVFSGIFGSKAGEMLKKMKAEGKKPRVVCAAFSGSDANYGGEVFEGAELCAVFGGVECDLRGAIIEKDCVIHATALFGGIDILVPAGVNVRVNSTCIFGGVSNKTAATENAPTLYIGGICMFGGVEIK